MPNRGTQPSSIRHPWSESGLRGQAKPWLLRSCTSPEGDGCCASKDDENASQEGPQRIIRAWLWLVILDTKGLSVTPTALCRSHQCFQLNSEWRSIFDHCALVVGLRDCARWSWTWVPSPFPVQCTGVVGDTHFRYLPTRISFNDTRGRFTFSPNFCLADPKVRPDP